MLFYFKILELTGQIGIIFHHFLILYSRSVFENFDPSGSSKKIPGLSLDINYIKGIYFKNLWFKPLKRIQVASQNIPILSVKKRFSDMFGCSLMWYLCYKIQNHKIIRQHVYSWILSYLINLRTIRSSGRPQPQEIVRTSRKPYKPVLSPTRFWNYITHLFS